MVAVMCDEATVLKVSNRFKTPFPHLLSSTYYLEEYPFVRLVAQLNLTELIKMQEWKV